MIDLKRVQTLMQEKAQPGTANSSTFFKTDQGQYADHDQFLNISVPNVRIIAKIAAGLTLEETQTLFESSINEERLLALFILMNRYAKADSKNQEEIYQIYMTNLKFVNNWNLVDASAPGILGAHLINRNKYILVTLAESKNLWERRIAIVSTQYFIRQNNLEWTFKIAALLLKDTHDLIHKATGWMLREAGKRDENQLRFFLDQHASQMPRTMLRYAIERFSEALRQDYLRGFKSSK